MPNLDYIWSVNEQKLTPMKRWRLRATKRLVIVVESITKNNLMSYASALTYSSILAAVPVLAIVFAVARGFGFGSLIEDKLRESLQVGPQITDTVLQFVDSYLEHTHSGVFIGAGIIFLLYTLLSLTSNVETAFNTIWFINTPRNIYRRITDYISVFLLLPFVVVVVSSLNIYLLTVRELFPDYALLSNTAERFVKVSPVLLVCTAFVLLYKLMPNTHVKLRHTFWPGIVCGICFMAVQYFYFHYQIKLSNYNAIYGSFAALPLFMLWVQISWTICLFGVELCYTNQNMDELSFMTYTSKISHRYKLLLSVTLMSHICHRFAEGRKPYTALDLKMMTDIPIRITQDLLYNLVSVGLLSENSAEGKDAEPTYQPALSLEHITIGSIVERLDSLGEWHLDIDVRKQLENVSWREYMRERKAYLDNLRKIGIV